MKLVFVFVLFAWFSKPEKTEQPPFRLPLEVIAKDKHNNEWIQLQLLNNQRYLYNERYVDGTTLSDSGTWVYQKGKLCLTSTQKSQRTSFSMNQPGKGSFKFRNECFEWDQASSSLQATPIKGPNAYFKKYHWISRTTAE